MTPWRDVWLIAGVIAAVVFLFAVFVLGLRP